MKVIVSHIGKQHVNVLLIALSKKGFLKKFFTSIATNKLPFVASLSKKWQAKLRKRYFTDIDSRVIHHYPFIAFLSAVIKSEYRRIFSAYKIYDKMVARRLKTADFDIFLSYENINLVSFQAAKARGKITVLDLAAIHFSFQNPVLKKLGTFQNQAELERICAEKEAAFAYTDYVLTLSNFAKYTLIQSGFPADRIFKTYLGVNHKVFRPKTQYNIKQTTQNTEGGQKDKNKSQPFELYFVGTMTTRKGLPFLLEVHKTLIARGLDIRLTLIGPLDDFTPPTKETPQYRYIPFLNHDELVKMHHSLDLFVFPSYLDSWGQVVVEAMACGSPVLVSDSTGAKDAVEKGGGYVLPVDDLEAWTSGIEQFYRRRFLLEIVGQQAAVVAQDYTWDTYHQQVIDAMLTIVKRNTDYISDLEKLVFRT